MGHERLVSMKKYNVGSLIPCNIGEGEVYSGAAAGLDESYALRGVGFVPMVDVYPAEELTEFCGPSDTCLAAVITEAPVQPESVTLTEDLLRVLAERNSFLSVRFGDAGIYNLGLQKGDLDIMSAAGMEECAHGAELHHIPELYDSGTTITRKDLAQEVRYFNTGDVFHGWNIVPGQDPEVVCYFLQKWLAVKDGHGHLAATLKALLPDRLAEINGLGQR